MDTARDAEVARAYAAGQRSADAWYGDDNLLWAAYEAGRSGLRAPVRASAWRYGHIPASGRSYNKADGVAELGVSCLGGDSDDIITIFGRDDGRPLVRVTGWLVPQTGSDSEPLICDAVEVSDARPRC